MSYSLFTAWGYEISILEFVASVTSLIGVWLGTTGKRITWPFWAASSALYAIFFYQANLIASAALQFVFIAAAFTGWRGWAPTGAKPGPLKNKYRLYTLAAIVVATLILGPVLKSIGAASTYVDAILFFGSLTAQILMVYEKYDSWPLWLVVDLGYVALYATQGLLFTTLLYVAFTIMAAVGWRAWYGSHKRALRPL